MGKLLVWAPGKSLSSVNALAQNQEGTS